MIQLFGAGYSPPISANSPAHSGYIGMNSGHKRASVRRNHAADLRLSEQSDRLCNPKHHRQELAVTGGTVGLWPAIGQPSPRARPARQTPIASSSQPAIMARPPSGARAPTAAGAPNVVA